MICPHCQKELPENYLSPDCPYCGEHMEVNDGMAQSISERRFSWLWILLVIAAPAIFNFVLASFAAESDAVVMMILGIFFVGSPIAGIAAAVLLVRWRKGDPTSSGMLNGVAFSILFVAVSFLLCFAGCSAGLMVSGI